MSDLICFPYEERGRGYYIRFTRNRRRAWPASAPDPSSHLNRGINTGDDDCDMPDVEALHLARLVVDLADHVLVYERWGKSEQPYEEFERQGEVKSDIGLVVELMVSVSAQILGVVSHGLPKLLGVV